MQSQTATHGVAFYGFYGFHSTLRFHKLRKVEFLQRSRTRLVMTILVNEGFSTICSTESLGDSNIHTKQDIKHREEQ